MFGFICLCDDPGCKHGMSGYSGNFEAYLLPTLRRDLLSNAARLASALPPALPVLSKVALRVAERLGKKVVSPIFGERTADKQVQLEGVAFVAS